MNKSPHESPHVVMSSHHILVYLVIEEKNANIEVDIHPYEEKARGVV
jgi:hypothetical protein